MSLKSSPQTNSETKRPGTSGELSASDVSTKSSASRAPLTPVDPTAQRWFKVAVPPTVQPGGRFQIRLDNGQKVQLRCPANLLKTTREIRFKWHSLDPMEPEGQTYTVTVPHGPEPNSPFLVLIENQRLQLRTSEKPGTKIRVRVAVPPSFSFDVVIPSGVRPGQSFVARVRYPPGVQTALSVTCPQGSRPGNRVRCQILLRDLVDKFQLRYDSYYRSNNTWPRRWVRAFRQADLMLHWVQDDDSNRNNTGNEENGCIGSKQAFLSSVATNAMTAYVRKLNVLNGVDVRMPTGTTQFVPVDQSSVHSLYINKANRLLVSCSEISRIEKKSCSEKVAWIKEIVQQLTPSEEDEHIEIRVRYSHLLSDSMDYVMALSCEDMRKPWRVDVIEDYTSPRRPLAGSPEMKCSWLSHVSQTIFDPSLGLWVCRSSTKGKEYDINPQTGSKLESHLAYFRFFGRMLGRAVLEGKGFNSPLDLRLFKHILGWPVTAQDSKPLDEDYLRVLRKLPYFDDLLSQMCLSFIVAEEPLLPQLTEILLGFADAIPDPVAAVLSPTELRWMACGIGAEE